MSAATAAWRAAALGMDAAAADLATSNSPAPRTPALRNFCAPRARRAYMAAPAGWRSPACEPVDEADPAAIGPFRGTTFDLLPGQRRGAGAPAPAGAGRAGFQCHQARRRRQEPPAARAGHAAAAGRPGWAFDAADPPAWVLAPGLGAGGRRPGDAGCRRPAFAFSSRPATRRAVPLAADRVPPVDLPCATTCARATWGHVFALQPCSREPRPPHCAARGRPPRHLPGRRVMDYLLTRSAARPGTR